MLRRPPLLALLLFGLSVAGCGVGSAPGGGDDDSSDGTGDGSGDGANAPDAIPPEPILCATEYTVTGGDVSHSVTPGESCEASGTWAISVGTPVPDEEYTGCGDAPGDAGFNLNVTTVGEDQYEVSDNDDGSRSWTVGVSDKAGSCSATFEMDLGGGTSWSLHPSENGIDGPLHGTARYEKRSE